MVQSPRSAADSPLFRAVGETFARMNWKGRRVQGREVIEADFEAHHTRVPLHVQVFAELGAVSVVAHAGHKIPDSRSGVVGEALMRTNKQLTVGNFELDYDRSAVLFRATNLFPHGRADDEIVASLVHSAVAEIDRLTPFLTLLLRMTPEELSMLNVSSFLLREDLLPPVPHAEEQTP